MHQYDVLRRPVVTEKTDILGERSNQVVFEVHPGANKRQITEAVQALFSVNVLAVRTMMMPGKTRRWGRHHTKTPAWKKAVVTLAEGQRIEFGE
jgi:large subunit ribosomal protein L23